MDLAERTFAGGPKAQAGLPSHFGRENPEHAGTGVAAEVLEVLFVVCGDDDTSEHGSHADQADLRRLTPVEWWCPFLMPTAASSHDFWQDFLRADDPVLTAPSYHKWKEFACLGRSRRAC